MLFVIFVEKSGGWNYLDSRDYECGAKKNAWFLWVNSVVAFRNVFRGVSTCYYNSVIGV
jgi:hypothetical protein